jgi:hypothetical protein
MQIFTLFRRSALSFDVFKHKKTNDFLSTSYPSKESEGFVLFFLKSRKTQHLPAQSPFFPFLPNKKSDALPNCGGRRVFKYIVLLLGKKSFRYGIMGTFFLASAMISINFLT